MDAAALARRKSLAMARPRTKKAKSIEQEEYVADLLGGRRTPSSGAAENDKGDIITPENLIEAKYTENKSVSIKRVTWEKIHEEAWGRGRRPAMTLRFRDEKNLDLVVLSLNDYTELIELVRGHYDNPWE